MLQTLSIWILAQTLRNICGDPNPVRCLQPKKVPPGQGGDQKRLSPLLLMGNPAQPVQTATNQGKGRVGWEGAAGLWCPGGSSPLWPGCSTGQPSTSRAGEGCEASTEEEEEDASAPPALPSQVFIAPPPFTGMDQ